MYQATTTQELLQEQILYIVENADNMTRSDIEGVVMALASQYELIERGE